MYECHIKAFKVPVLLSFSFVVCLVVVDFLFKISNANCFYYFIAEILILIKTIMKLTKCCDENFWFHSNPTNLNEIIL